MAESGPDSEPQEQALLEQAVRGEEQALVALLYQHYDQLAAHVRRAIPLDLQGVLDAEDILQQTFVKAFQGIRAFEPQGLNSFYRWLKTIADRTFIDELRKRRCRPDLAAGTPANGQAVSDERPAGVEGVSGHEETPSHAVARHEAARVLHGALPELPTRQRDAVRLVYLEEQSVSTVAGMMGTSKAGVRSLVQRGLEKLRDVLGTMSNYLSRR